MATVPRTRGHLDREQKVGEVLDRAEAQLLGGGYGSLSIAELARELGLAQNAIYWYFPTKDHLFVATVERLMQRVVASKPHGVSLLDKILWFVDRLAELEVLRVAVRDRGRSSGLVAEFELRLSQGIRKLLHGALSSSIPRTQLEITVDTLLATIDGALMRSMTNRHRRRVVRYAFERLVGNAAPDN
jgi:AcrR family transcriptional regulator